ncbi:hypothetical protein JXA34_02865 [Patescibacteria group bacterium]|nr:hypothetical protein [Patescibacteria group bacterium]
MNDNHLKLIKQIIGSKTGHTPQEITPDSYIEDDLNIGEMELLDILTEVDETLETDISQNIGEIETVQDILDLLSEEIE